MDYQRCGPILTTKPVLHGVKRSTSGPRRQQRLPITPEVLSRLRDVWAPRANERDIVMLWTACCLAFFGFQRSGELTVQSVQAFDSSVHLTVSDVAVDSRQNPFLMRVRLKQSKNGSIPAGCRHSSWENGFCTMSYYGDAGLSRLARSRGRPLVSGLGWNASV